MPVSPLGLDDPAARTAYLATKAVVMVLAAAASWLLAPRFGPRVWLAWAIFAAVLVLLAVVLLRAGARGSRGAGAGMDTDTGTVPDPDTRRGAGAEDATGDGSEAAEAWAGPVVLPVEDALDLHPFAPEEIPSVVASYLEAAWEAGFREVRLIHGKGIGVQRARVHRLLSRHPLVLRYADAPPERGGWGATVARLTDERETSSPAPESRPRPRG